ncbi:hypothetical protein FACS1894180_6090 [Bacteroidia bacterium]|nr:hypothetical protein FACS1894180_6090 [Bacteroidia bacterium]
MRLEKYPLTSSDKLTTFEFISEGDKGLIHKLVRYQPTNLKGVFNLAFGDKDHETGDIDDTIISNNGDSEKVLATVTATVYAFTDKYPDAWIYATGSTKSRTRLYRMGITKFLSDVKKDFEILGERNDDWENFRKDVEYNGFLVRRIKNL